MARWAPGILAAALLCGVGRLRAQEPPPGAEAPAPTAAPLDGQGKAAYWKDARFERLITFRPDRKVKPPELFYVPPKLQEGVDDPGPGGPARLLNARLYPAQEVAAAITKQVGVPVIIQGDLGREKVVVGVNAGAARELMDRLVEAFFPVRWHQAGEKWVLAFSPREAALTVMPQRNRDQNEVRCVTDLLRQLTPREWRQLQRTGTLVWEEMSPGVQRACRSLAETFQYDPERNILNAFVPSASREGGFFLKLNSNPTDAILSVLHPAHTFGVGIPFIEKGRLRYGVGPPP